MTNGSLLGAMLITTVAGSTEPPPRSRPPRRQRAVRRPLAVCAALVISVTLAIAAGFASSAIARPVVGGGPTINGTEEATAEPTHGPTINGTDEATAEPTPKDPAADGDDTPWALAVIGTGLALGAIGVGISRRLNHSRTSPGAPSVSGT
jgi:hypothetical protein